MKKVRMENEVMAKIQERKLKMKPRWQFAAEDNGVRGAWLLMILIVAVAISVLVYFFKIYNPQQLQDYGEVGTELFFMDFPYVWFVAGIVLFGGGLISFSKVGENYKKPMRVVVLLTTLAVIGATIGVVLVSYLLRIGL